MEFSRSRLLSFFLFTVLFQGVAVAGPAIVIGNGGDVVSCDGKLEVLDHFEARTRLGLMPVFPEKEGSAEGIAAELVDRLPAHDGARRARYREWLRSFPREMRLEKVLPAKDIPDSWNVPLPSGCELIQLAIQIPPERKGAPRYLVQRDLWERLDARQRATLYLHEIIYREAIGKGHVISSLVRKFAAHLLGDRLRGLSRVEYARHLEEVSLGERPPELRRTPEVMVSERCATFRLPAGRERWTACFKRGTFRQEKDFVTGSLDLPQRIAVSFDANSATYGYEVFEGSVEIWDSGFLRRGVAKSPVNLNNASGAQVTIPAGRKIKLNRQGFLVP